jgi:hypothetical protein
MPFFHRFPLQPTIVFLSAFFPFFDNDGNIAIPSTLRMS